MGFMAIPTAGLGFFFSAWLTMIFWGIVGSWVNVKTLGYVDSMVVTIGIWLVVAPLAAAMVRRGGRCQAPD